MKYVYMFREGDASMRDLLGGKGANLCEMTNIGLPVPQGFIVSTDACLEFIETNQISDEVEKQILKAIKNLERATGKKLGDEKNPLILSVRSGARVSMPGMMDSILNLGLNDVVVKSFANQVEPKFAYDCYRRFIQMYSNVVEKINDSLFEKEISKIKKQENITYDKDLSLQNIKDLIKSFKAIYRMNTGKSFPQDVHKLLFNCIEAVFKSWNNERAIVYRNINNIPHNWGTAVNVQMMVFGNMNEKSGTGVCFSRNPITGENSFYGEFLLNAQGEDIVAGVRTPKPIDELKKFNPAIYIELKTYADKLEKVYRDMQDMEFTIQDNELYILQTRNAKRTTMASVRIAVDLVKEKLIGKGTAVARIDAEKITEIMHQNLVIPKSTLPIANGIPASPGGAVGRVVLSVEKAKQLKKQGEKTILVRFETSAEDIEGMTISEGVLTARGGTTSHAAVVARGLGTVCISGCSNLQILKNGIKLNGTTIKEGEFISLDGETGNIYAGALKISKDYNNEYLETIIDWAKEEQRIKVYANADSIKDTKEANKFDIDGIGLCRTEHMFFEDKRIVEMQKMILAEDELTRKLALKKLLTFQQKDFTQMFTSMKNKSLTIRLLDPPLHEFMPKNQEQIEILSKLMKMPTKSLITRIEDLFEVNPMMGHRGLRLAVSYPEIYEMQTEAIIESALLVQKELKIKVCPEIMVPLTSDIKEFLFVKNIIQNVLKKHDPKHKVKVKIGTMIETPRACLIAGDLAQYCDFFSFGTNDLTQFVYGFSRDDSVKFMSDYIENNIFKTDIFMHLDTVGVGKLMQEAVQSAKRINPDIKIGICGEQAGDPATIKFCRKIGLDYVSCSCGRIPVAIIASAQ